MHNIPQTLSLSDLHNHLLWYLTLIDAATWNQFQDDPETGQLGDFSETLAPVSNALCYDHLHYKASSYKEKTVKRKERL